MLEKRVGKNPTSDQRRPGISKMPVSARISRRKRGFLEERKRLHGALAAETDTASGCRSYIQAKEVFILCGAD